MLTPSDLRPGAATPIGSGTTPPIGPPAAAGATVRRFRGSAQIDGSTAQMMLRDIADEIFALLASDPDATVQVALDVSADLPASPEDHVKRGVPENATSLGFTTKAWE
jgi:hypothetical protein